MFYDLLFIHSLVDLLADVTEWFKDIFTEFMTVIILPLFGMWLRNKWAYKRAIKNGDEPPVTITQRVLKVFKRKNKDKQDKEEENKDKKKKQDKGTQTKQSKGISKKEMQRLLELMENEEQKVQQKVLKGSARERQKQEKDW